MKTFKIAYLYYDLMNLYGENGNILAIKKHLENENLNVKIDYLSLNEDKDFSKYDMYYIGCGDNQNFKLALDDLMKYQEDIKKSIKNQDFWLVTGNAINLFGKTYETTSKEKWDCLGIFSFKSIETEFQIVGEQEYQSNYIDEPIIGFINRYTVISDVKEKALFRVINGSGYMPKDTIEGIMEYHFYGTYLLGPLLIRNPYFTEYLVKEILKSQNMTYQKYENPWEIKAYLEYQKNFLHKKN